jgi:hypothetical protein
VTDTLYPDGHIEGLKTLTELINMGYTSAGVNYGCGCTKSAWFKDGQLVDEYATYCEEHENNRNDRLPPT